MKDRLYSDEDLAQFYDYDNEWGEDLTYCARLAEDAASVLDLGCGTGIFLSRLTPRDGLVGVDPAHGMLEMARRREGTAHIEWIAGDARHVRLERRFDLVVMTGHAFQVFLTEADRRAVIATIAAHLVPGGRFVFDTRDPADDDWRSWTPEETLRSFAHPDHGRVEAWNDVSCDEASGVVTYETHYRLPGNGQHFWAASKIAFPAREELAAALEEAGLVVDQWLGDWRGNAHGDGSPDIIPLGRLR